MSQLADHLVGRAVEMATLGAVLDGLDGGEGGAVWIEGGPGIGKSRLVAELLSRSEERGHLALAGGASELERDLPFGAFVDAMDDYLATVEPHRLSRLGADVLGELSRVFPALADRAPAGHAKPLHDERYRSHRAVRALLETLAGKPLVLVLDDLHWADAASVELAGALLRRPPAGRVLLVLATRPPPAGHALAATAARADRGGRLVRVALAPLTLDGTRALLGDGCSAALAAAVHEESGGVPFYVEQLARALRHGDRLPTAPAGSGTLADVEVPAAVVAGLRDELAQLGASTRRVLEGAAVAGDPSSPSSPPPRPASTSPPPSRRSTRCSPRSSCARRTSRAASASAIRSCAGPSTRARRPGGGSAPTSDSPPRWGPVARRPRPAPTTSSARRARATPPRSPCCARRAIR
ncbi:MAG TPA: AAA family ATPase, partial [Solirubrobacteraceae bacterium]